MKQNIILSAKEENNDLQLVRGKPPIAWVIESLPKHSSITIVLNSVNEKLTSYLQKLYAKKFHLSLVHISGEEEIGKYNKFSIVNSIKKGLDSLPKETTSVEIILGDTLLGSLVNEEPDLILTSKDFITSERWCLVEINKDNTLKKIYDKEKDIDISDKYAIIGFYRFSDVELLNKSVNKVIKNTKPEISSIILEYNQKTKIKFVEYKYWLDLGHKAGLVKAQNNFFNSRDFNSLKVDPVKGTISKSSAKKQKLEDEFFWYTNLPAELSVFAPRVFNFEQGIDSACIEMEMYGYPALSEMFVFSSYGLEEWELVLRKLFDIHKLFDKYEGEINKEDLYDLYLHKTWQRLKELMEQNPIWKEYWDYETLVINGVEHKNIRSFEVKINDKIEELINDAHISVIHGDYCFSNILFDTNSYICRLIDPRGRLKKQTIYGDSSYDIAKLRHSVVGNYDFIVHSLFDLKEDKNVFETEEYVYDFYKDLGDVFDNFVKEFGYDVENVKFIEALLFTSMIPLHKDDLPRQKMFYLKAVQKLNQIFEGK